MVAKFVDHNNRELKQRRRRRQREQENSNRFRLKKTINMHVHHAFVHFSDVRARLGHETSLFHAFTSWSR